jgi:hypothetical protein
MGITGHRHISVSVREIQEGGTKLAEYVGYVVKLLFAVQAQVHQDLVIA